MTEPGQEVSASDVVSDVALPPGEPVVEDAPATVAPDVDIGERPLAPGRPEPEHMALALRHDAHVPVRRGRDVSCRNIVRDARVRDPGPIGAQPAVPSGVLFAAVMLQLVATMLSAATMYLRPMIAAACTTYCDYQMLANSVNAYFIITGVVTVLGPALIFALRRKGAWIIAPPVLATAVVTFTYLVADSFSRQAVGLS